MVATFLLQYDVSPYVVDGRKFSNTFGEENPTLRITGSLIDGIDGDYYVLVIDDRFLWISLDGSYGIVWAE